MIDLSGLSTWAQFWITLFLMVGVTTVMVVIVLVATVLFFGRNRR